ncbi:hypothetical protein [Nocardia concava]|uniref:hypothetical protein n=1 Tax=Nocardia concava TaxID=257281 RepID=UPI0002F8C5F0|nr:hypothetical protein [Nocardia concava]
MNNTVQIRLSGDLGDITMVIAELLASKQFRMVVDETPYRNRTGAGVRVYIELAMPPAAGQAPDPQPPTADKELDHE